jgi:carbonic anhydrase
MNIDDMIKGNKKFQEIHFPKLEGKFDDLVENGQKPKILFIGLSDEPHLVHVKKWLELGHKAKEYTLLATPNKNDMEQILRTTERISIKHQLENLLTYPEIYRKVKSGELDIHGWYYKIEDGSIEYYDGESCGFKVLGE